ncbi:hypothetical protein QJQ45_015495 [Haematococcus lacustris]|nr:hypothetical protein QJQ45_015495 [Haematococcus lacustris]
MAQPTRPFDALYDTCYTVSGARDHYRQQTVAGGFSVERAPDYPNMFSELPHYPASGYRLKNTEKVPAFVDRTFHPEVKDAADMTQRSQPTVVAGQQRYLYFRRPLLAAPEPVLIKRTAAVPAPPISPQPPAPKSKTIGTQSDYRESEAQTTPWQPDLAPPKEPSLKQQYLSARNNCEGPELLQLKDLKFGEGLPPGLQDIRRIEKLREKRKFEASLPPVSDLSQLPLRQKMIEEWEAREWDEREEEILGVQDERLVLLQQAIQVREEEFDERCASRVEARKVAQLEAKSSRFAEIQAARIKTMRQLLESRKYAEKPRRLVRPGIVERYANYSSTTYAPVQREGRFPEAKPNGRLIETDGYQPVNLQGIADLEAYLPPRLLNPKISAPTAPVKLSYKQRKEACVQRDLKAINDLLDLAKTTRGRGFGECWPSPLKELEAGLIHHLPGGSAAAAVASLRAATGMTKDPTIGAGAMFSGSPESGQPGGRGRALSPSSLTKNRRTVTRVVERPGTPELPPPSTAVPGQGADAMDRDTAATLLQRLLRGRAAQNIMYEGRMRRQDLIAELRISSLESGDWGGADDSGDLGDSDDLVAVPRPEALPAGLVLVDALLGSLLSQLLDAATITSDSRRAVALAAALAPLSPEPELNLQLVAAAAGPRAHVRQVMDVPAADLEKLARAVHLASTWEDEEEQQYDGRQVASRAPQLTARQAAAAAAEAGAQAGAAVAVTHIDGVEVDEAMERKVIKIQALQRKRQAQKRVAALKAERAAAVGHTSASQHQLGVTHIDGVPINADMERKVIKIQALQRKRQAQRRVAALKAQRAEALAAHGTGTAAGAVAGMPVHSVEDVDTYHPADATLTEVEEARVSQSEAATTAVTHIDGVPVTADMERKVVQIQALQRRRQAQRRVAALKAERAAAADKASQSPVSQQRPPVTHIDGVPVDADMERKVVQIQALQRKRQAQRRVAALKAERAAAPQSDHNEADNAAVHRPLRAHSSADLVAGEASMSALAFAGDGDDGLGLEPSLDGPLGQAGEGEEAEAPERLVPVPGGEASEAGFSLQPGPLPGGEGQELDEVGAEEGEEVEASNAGQEEEEGLNAGQEEEEGLNAGQEEEEGLNAGQEEEEGLNAGQEEEEGLNAGQEEEEGLNAGQEEEEGLNAGQEEEEGLNAGQEEDDGRATEDVSWGGDRGGQHGPDSGQGGEGAGEGPVAEPELMEGGVGEEEEGGWGADATSEPAQGDGAEEEEEEGEDA